MFFKKLFPGGVHPSEYRNGKSVTSKNPIVNFLQPKKVVISMSQHLGSPSRCLIKKGDTVSKGQLIGESTGFVSANVHASISGKVVSVEKQLMPNGIYAIAVTIENDMTDESTDFHPIENINDISLEDFVNAVKNAGIVGLGGAAFPTHVKLLSKEPIDTLVINGSECEPYLSSDHCLMLQDYKTIIDGILLVKNKLNAKHVVIGIEDNKKDAINLFVKETSQYKDISVKELKTIYPEGGEKQLIYACTRRKVPMGKLPLHVGVCVLNVSTCFAISEAIRKGKPLIDRVITIAGSVNTPKNLRVPVGTLISDIIDTCDGLSQDTEMVIYGGPMMGSAISSIDTPILKGCSGIVALETTDNNLEETPCIHCGRCSYACPMLLSPSDIDRNVRIGRGTENESFNVMNCIECGVCSYVCPAKRKLTQSCKYSKYLVRENMKRREGDKK